MFFYLAKGLWFLLQPSTLIALLIGYGAILIWTGWARWGRRFVTIGAILLLLAGLSPLGNVLILPLENRFPRTNLDSPPPPTGFIILGGAEDRLVGTTRHAPALNEAAERIVEGAILAQRFPTRKSRSQAVTQVFFTSLAARLRAQKRSSPQWVSQKID
jgi:uncharacterized SAM-binding protein YcdF (DUF218 family)